MATSIFDALYQPGQIFSLRQIVALCREHPEIVAINSNMQQKAGLPIKVKANAKLLPDTFNIAGLSIGPDHPCFIIAEAGVNHNGSLAMAKELVDLAVDAKANAVKFQTFKAELVISPTARKAAYQQQTTSAEESQLDMVRLLQLPYSAFRELQAYCTAKGILFLSTPFDSESLAFLDSLDMPVVKVPSGEITTTPSCARSRARGAPSSSQPGCPT